jgi:hypothetical protein
MESAGERRGYPKVRYQSEWRKKSAEVISDVLDQCGALLRPEDIKTIMYLTSEWSE